MSKPRNWHAVNAQFRKAGPMDSVKRVTQKERKEQDEQSQACAACGAEPGTNIDCGFCMSLWAGEDGHERQDD